MDNTADRLANLSPEKRALLERMRGRQVDHAPQSPAGPGASGPAEHPVVPRGAGEPAVLTAVQRRLWLLSQLDVEAGAAYNVPRIVRLAGTLDVDALRSALTAVVARHEVLRTRVLLGDGTPVAVIDPPRPVELPVIAVTAASHDSAPADAFDAAVRHATTEAARPFDLASDLLLRAMLIRIADSDHLLVLTTHHVASDESSRSILLGDLAAAYAAAIGEPQTETALTPPALQYADYASWQLARERAGVLDEHVDYWAHHLGGAPDDVDLPTDHPRPATRRMDGQRLVFDLDADVAAGVAALARTAATTRFTVILAAFYALLYRLSGQDDLVVGIPVSGRHRAELADVVGCFANTLALRVGLDGDVTFRELLGQVHTVSRDGLAHQEAPFDLVVERLAPPRDPGKNALFQICYNHVAGSTDVTGFPGITARIVDIDPGVAKFDLTLVTRETGASSSPGLRALWEMRTDLFDAATVERWHRHFVVLLRAALAAPDTAVGSLPLLEAADLDAIRAGLHATATAIDPLPLPALVRRQVEATPDAVAVVDEESRLTYHELDAAAGEIAATLRTLGVRKGDLVAVCVERSSRMVAALLGVHRAGGAYVPLDPTFPADRLAFMLSDSGARVAVTQASLRHVVEGDGRALLVLDEPPAPPASAPAEPAELADPEFDDLAYAIYTSGSTGLPKGVLIEHGALSNFLQSMATRPGCVAGDVLVAVTTLSFDIAGLELFLPLITGATVVVASRDVAADPAQLATLLDASGATILQATPSTWRMLVDSGWPGRPGLKMLCGGEALPPTLAAALHSRGAQLWNMYGPTETTIWSSVDQVVPDQPVRLGDPIANTDFLVVDTRLEPVPTGVAGELLIGGLGLARGYHNRAELTAEKFVAHPLSPGARSYRTGDLVRAHRDGTLEFLGRLDHQVKVRGFRIELGEVERALASHGAVREVVAVVREDRPGDRQLIAYVVAETPDTAADEPGEVDSQALRHHVAGRLPAYMVPSVVVVLEELPRTPNGKTDRKRLPAPAEADVVDDAFEPPRTPLERQVAQVWADVLGIARVGVRDNFFALGGDSLRAVRVVSLLRDEFSESQLSIRSFVDCPTVEDVVALISGETILANTTGQAHQLPGPTRRGGSQHPLSFTQQRMWFIDRLEPDSPLYTVAAAYRIDGPLDVDVLQRALDAIVSRHEILRSVLLEDDGEPVQRVQPAFRVPLEVKTVTDDAAVDTAEASARAEQMVNAAAAVPFDLATGPLVRSVVVRVDDQQALFALLLHHAVVDGWAIDLLVDELAAHYAAGGVAELDEPALQFGDYARWQRETLDGDVLDQQLAYWRNALLGAPDILPLPTDRPRPPQQSYRGARFSTQLPSDLVERMAGLAKAEGATLFQVLLAGFTGLLARYSGQDDIVVGTSISGRDRSALHGLVGYLANTIALRVDASEDPTPRELLARARSTVNAATEHGDLPFDRLVDSLNLPRDLSRNPLFQVMLLMQPPRPPARRLTDATMHPVSLDRGTARFDLTVSCTRTPDGATLGVEYSTDLFDEATIRELMSRFNHLLTAVVSTPDTPLSRLPLLTADEARAALTAATGAEVQVDDVTLPRLLARQAALRPDAPAVEGGGRSYTYAELDARASQLAHALIEAGVSRGDLVAVGLPRSADLLVALFGIQRAGAAYVPLEPTYPAERLEFMLADSEVRAIVTSSDIELPQPEQPLHRLLLDDPATLAPYPATDPGVAVAPDDLAYVIYTSGSTGKPKGVLIQHRGAVNLLAEMAQRPGLRPGETMVGVTTPAFDLSIPDLFLPLTSGARLVLADPQVAADPLALAALLDDVDADLMQATPSTWRMLLDAGWAGRPTMRVVCGGEGYTAALAAPLAAKVAQVWNFYGPTEATVWCTSAHLAAPVDPLPLGRPLPNCSVYVADSAGKPVPPGVAGEVVIGGMGLARGYHRRPELTAERFVHTDGPLGSERIYRTGDLGRTRRDGTLQFLGRIDHQVKLRGFRIELGEIEQVLDTHAAVREAVVVLREDSPGDQRLIAYAVLDPQAPPIDSAHLRKHVGATLPAYMVPSAVIVLPAMPRTPNGKTDRARLPTPSPEAATSRDSVAPRTPIEEEIAQMWCEVLRLDHVGVHDDFFTLGGHSLRITQVMSRLRTAFGVDLPLRQVYEAPTVAAMAEAVTLALLGDESLADFIDEVGD